MQESKILKADKLIHIFNVTFREQVSSESFISVLLPFLFVKFIEDSGDVERKRMGISSNKVGLSSLSVLLFDNASPIHFWSDLEHDIPVVSEILSKFNLDNVYQISDDMTDRIIGILNQYDFSEGDYHFKHILDAIIKYDIQASGRKGSEYTQQKQLSDLMMSFCPTKGGLNVYNPFAGTASLAINLPDDAVYFGDEINHKTWAIAKMRLLANGIYESFLKANNSFENWGSGLVKKKYDFIVSNPPFSVKEFLKNPEDSFYKTSESFIISRTVESLKTESRGVIAIPLGFLFRSGSDEKLRKELIKSNLIELIISLPPKTLSVTGIPIALIVLNTSKSNSTISLIDATSCIDQDKSNRSINILDTESIFDIISNIDSEKRREVTLDKVIENQYNLNVNRYFIEEISIEEGEKIVKLGDLIKIVRNKDVRTNTICRLIKPTDMSNSSMDIYRSFESVQPIKIKHPAAHISNNTLLLNTVVKDGSMYPTFYKSKNPIEKIYVRHWEVKSYSVNDSIVDVEYLINELHNKYVEDQVKAFSVGTSINKISLNDVLDLNIILPSIERQRELISEKKSEFISNKQLELEDLQKFYGIKKDEDESIRFIKHSLSAPLSNVESYFDDLKNIILKSIDTKEVLSLDSNLEDDEENLDTIIEIIVKGINESLSVLNNLNNDYFINNENNNDGFDIFEALSDLENNYRRKNYKVSYNTDNDSISEFSEINELIIDGDKNDFLKLCNNLIDNSSKHAFIGSDNYFVDFDLSIVKNYAVMIVTNNGLPFQKGFTMDKFIRKNSKTGDNANTGYGGFLINNITKAMNGEFNYISNIKDEKYVTEFTFKFPLIIE